MATMISAGTPKRSSALNKISACCFKNWIPPFIDAGLTNSDWYRCQESLSAGRFIASIIFDWILASRNHSFICSRSSPSVPSSRSANSASWGYFSRETAKTGDTITTRALITPASHDRTSINLPLRITLPSSRHQSTSCVHPHNHAETRHQSQHRGASIADQR